jgi:hypothetical protein
MRNFVAQAANARLTVKTQIERVCIRNEVQHIIINI